MTFADISFFQFTRNVKEEDLDNPGTFLTTSIPLQTARNEIPVVFSSGDPSQYAAETVRGIKIARTPGDMTVRIPVRDYSSGDASAYISRIIHSNFACISYYTYKPKGQGTLSTDAKTPVWYSIAGYREVTNQSTADPTCEDRLLSEINLELDLKLMPLTTVCDTDERVITIIPERMPTETPHVVQNWTDSVMVKTAAETTIPSLPKLPAMKHTMLDPDTDRLLWCEVNFKDSSDSLDKYGFFVFARGIGGQLSSTLDVSVMYDSMTQTEGIDTYHIYPSIKDVIRDPYHYIGVAADKIFSITVSEFCPYKTITRALMPTIRIGDNAEIAADYLGPVADTDNNCIYCTYAYKLSNDILIRKNARLPSSDTSVTVTLTDFERHNGQLFIRDSMRNKVLAIPRELNASSMSLSVHTYSDLNNIYTVVKYNDLTVTLPGYLIPWTGSGWDTYRSFNLEYDRQALQNNVTLTSAQAATSIAGGAAAGALAGSVVPGIGNVAGAVVGASAGLVGTGISLYGKAKDQELTEQKMKNAPGSVNNPAYGYGVLDYISDYGGAEIILEMPAGFTKKQWEIMVQMWGFPSNKVYKTLEAWTEGYWKGRIFVNGSAELFNTYMADNCILNEAIDQLEAGAYIVPITLQ